ncbi:hypothetical protein Tdes44962_MAKER01785 [Teratosphaeria destructans]|uniref:Uncharacterized protein n=1 Tax=Teratosphaeria destructans TaxID=418781 RepID=A0A9W7W4X2_9PEZI|nr:hypothetical protein Tdes44962_MAKER01785 [Teratosphaeria destructans]
MDPDRSVTEPSNEMEATPKDESFQSHALEVPDHLHQPKASLPPPAAAPSYSEILRSSPVVLKAQMPSSSQNAEPSPLTQQSAQPHPPSHSEPAAQAQAPGLIEATAQTKPSDHVESSSHQILPEIKIDQPKDSPTAGLSSGAAPARLADVEPTVLPGYYDTGLGAVVCTPIDHAKGTNTVRYQEVRQMLGSYPGGLSADIPVAKALGLPLRFKRPTVYFGQDLGQLPTEPLRFARVIHPSGSLKKHGAVDDVKNEIIADLGLVIDPQSKRFGCVDERQKMFNDWKGQVMYWRADGLDLHPEHLDALMSYIKFYLKPLCRPLQSRRTKLVVRHLVEKQLLAKLTPDAFAEGFEAIRKWRIRTGDDFCDWTLAENPITGEYWGPLGEGEAEQDLMASMANAPDFEVLDNDEGLEAERTSAKENETPKPGGTIGADAASREEALQQVPGSMSKSKERMRRRKSRTGERVWDAAIEEGPGAFGPDLAEGMELEGIQGGQEFGQRG